jgi:hypothetical protein
MRTQRKFKIVEANLDGIMAAGLCSPPRRNRATQITIDPRQPPRMYLDSLVHELLHCADWNFSEAKVRRMSRIIATGLWRMGYRRKHA